MKRMLALLLVGLSLFPPAVALACGPFLPEAIFTFQSRPNDPIEEYARGELGIPQASYARAYLFVAYRNLSGRPLNAQEQRVFLETWDPARAARTGNAPPSEPNWIKAWADKRVSFLGPEAGKKTLGWYDPYGIHRWRVSDGSSAGFYNCLPDAFHTAVSTLEKRTEQFGATSSVVGDWLAAQDQVFQNCGEVFDPKAPKGPFLPPEARSDAPPIIRADRAYQIAAAYFYAGEFSNAATRFEQIAKDSSSPWQKIAPLLVGRALLRRATLSAEFGKADPAALREAEVQFLNVLADPGWTELHASAERLIAYVELRLHPERRLRELAAHLLKPDAAHLRQNLLDYTYLLDRVAMLRQPPGEEPENTGAEPSNRFQQLASAPSDEMTDWILTFQGVGPSALEHASSQWQKTSSLPWLVAALAKAHAPEPGLPALLAGAARVSPDSPGFALAAFHRFRLLAEAGGPEEARAGLDEFLARHEAALPRSALNLCYALRMKLARDLDEFLAYAPRVPAGVSYAWSERYAEPWATSESAKKLAPGAGLLDADAAQLLTRRMPLRTLARVAKAQELSTGLRREVALAAWTRAVLLKNDRVSMELVPPLESLAPEMKPDLDSFAEAKTNDARGFAAAYALLRFPGAHLDIRAGVGRETPLDRIDNLRDNWWSAIGPEGDRSSWWLVNPAVAVRPDAPLGILYPKRQVDVPTFLGASEQGEAEAEWKALSSVPTGPNALGSVVLEWAKQHRDDPRVPESLHLVVRATRYGVTDKQSGEFSKAAFELLQRRYPTSDWAKKTKYWYGSGR